MATAMLKIEGMTCDHCVRAVTGALMGVDGVRAARVDLERGRAVVEYDSARANPRDMANAVMDEGYSAEEIA